MAQPYRFRLQPVLDLREGEEDKAKEQLAETLSLRTQGQAMLRSAEELVAGAAQDERDVARRPATPGELEAAQRWRERLERHRVTAGQQLEHAEREVVLSRSALVEAHRRREALGRLREAGQRAHAEATAQREAAEVDEIALGQHHRRAREGRS